MSDERMMTGSVALAVGCSPHHVHRLARRGKIPAERCGRYYLIRRSHLARVREALEKAGFLKPAEAVTV